MAKNRKRIKIPTNIADDILRRAGFTCCVCRRRRAMPQLHHIDKNPRNSVEDNLAALCSLCHNEAHSTHELTQNLTPDRIRKAKAVWESELSQLAAARMSVNGGGALEPRIWTYFNFDVILRLSKPEEANQTALAHLRTAGIVNKDGFPVAANLIDNARTLFETLPADWARYLQQFYSTLVESVVEKGKPIDLEAIWTRSLIRRYVIPGALAFANVAFYWRKHNHERIATYKRAGIVLQYQITDWNIYSNSSYTLHFTGHTRSAAVLLIRSVEADEIDGKQALVIKATPVALGVCFYPSVDRTPTLPSIATIELDDTDFDAAIPGF